MPLETAKKIIDFAFEMTPSGEKISIGLFGGEPLLRFDLIQKITNYIRENEPTDKNSISISVTTNGILLNQLILDFFREEGIRLCLSIDGPSHVHDMNRRYKNGRGSFEDVSRILRPVLDQIRNVQVNAVYGPDTIEYLPETTSFFTRMGFPIIHLNPNISADWDRTTTSNIGEKYMQVAEHYIKCYERNREIAVNLIDNKIILLLKDGYEDSDKCGMGESEWGFAPSGNIYPCERFIGEDNDPSFCIGNIHTGIDKITLCNVIENRGNSNEECENCSFQKYCMNWCGCTNQYMTGRTDMASAFQCESEKAMILAAKHVLLTLKNNDLFLDHFYNYTL